MGCENCLFNEYKGLLVYVQGAEQLFVFCVTRHRNELRSRKRLQIGSSCPLARLLTGIGISPHIASGRVTCPSDSIEGHYGLRYSRIR